MSEKRNKMPGLRLKGGIWQIEKRCKYTKSGWLRESTETASRTEAEVYLIRRLAELEENARRSVEAIYTFEEAGLRYLDEIAHKSSAGKIAEHLDQLFPFIGNKTLEQVHDGTLNIFIEHEIERELAPKSINNVLGVASAVLNRAAKVWRNEEGVPWLRQAPPKITRLSLKGRQSKPYPLTWKEQDNLFKALPMHVAAPALFKVNTGCREQEVCGLKWEWEVPVDELGMSVFVLPETVTKTETERVVVLNKVARSVIDTQRGIHTDYVFTYRDKPMLKLHNSAWKRAWREAGLPAEKGILKGVHNLRHTFGRRLRGAGVPLETRKALLGHADGDITTHYSAAELQELMVAVEKITSRQIGQTPTLTLVKRKKKKSVGNVSENQKRVSNS